MMGRHFKPRYLCRLYSRRNGDVSPSVYPQKRAPWDLISAFETI